MKESDITPYIDKYVRIKTKTLRSASNTDTKYEHVGYLREYDSEINFIVLFSLWGCTEYISPNIVEKIEEVEISIKTKRGSSEDEIIN